jgi:hypothetical protein
MYNGSYQNTSTEALVETLLPLLYRTELPPVSQGGRPVVVEVVQHPFALTTIAHLDLAPVDPSAAGTAALNEVLRTPLTGPCQVRDGVPLTVVPELPELDADGQPAKLEEAGQFQLLSGLHFSAPDPEGVAQGLATLFESTKNEHAQPLKSDQGAIAIDAGRVGMVLPHTQYRAGARLDCLHHNLATLLAYMENLATAPPSSPTVVAEWFRRRAAVVLNHLYRRAPLPETSNIYRSRLPQAWIDYRQLAPALNSLTMGDLPALPAP